MHTMTKYEVAFGLFILTVICIAIGASMALSLVALEDYL